MNINKHEQKLSDKFKNRLTKLKKHYNENKFDYWFYGTIGVLGIAKTLAQIKARKIYLSKIENDQNDRLLATYDEKLTKLTKEYNNSSGEKKQELMTQINNLTNELNFKILNIKSP